MPTPPLAPKMVTTWPMSPPRHGHLGVRPHRQAQLLVVALEHELARAGAHRTQDQLGILGRRDDDDHAAAGGDVVDQAETIGRVGPDRDDRRARIQVPVFVGDQLGRGLRTDDVRDVFERQPHVGDCWASSMASSKTVGLDIVTLLYISE